MTSTNLPAAAIAELENGNMIEAIKIVREQTGLGLKEARDLVDRFNAGQSGVDSVQSIPMELQLPSEAISELYAGNKISAIKYVRECNRIGLKDAKDFVENYIDKNPDVKSAINAAQAKSFREFMRWLVPVILLTGLCVYYFTLP